EAYVDALAGIGVPLRDELIRDVDWGGTNAAAAIDDILDGTDPPTAVYAHSDELAFGVLRSLHRRGLRVPEDVSVIGIDDHPLAELTDLTTVRQPVREQGAIAARLVLDELDATDTVADGRSAAVTVPTTLVVRATTGPPGEYHAIAAASRGRQP
ncbi:MAG TPA: substrate-binding domain-containing protein, partial [Aldersonia sp.]